jgi:excisionase family DNA binding protein
MPQPLPRLTTTAAIAKYVGVSLDAVRIWIKNGTLRAQRVQSPRHYTDTRVRKTNRGSWRFDEEEVMRVLTSIRSGATKLRLPAWFWRTR